MEPVAAADAKAVRIVARERAVEAVMALAAATATATELAVKTAAATTMEPAVKAAAAAAAAATMELVVTRDVEARDVVVVRPTTTPGASLPWLAEPRQLLEDR